MSEIMLEWFEKWHDANPARFDDSMRDIAFSAWRAAILLAATECAGICDVNGDLDSADAIRTRFGELK